MSKAPIRIAVTGAAGQVGYALLFRIAGGDMLGKDQPVILQLLETTPSLPALGGVLLELEDGAFPLLLGIVHTDDPMVAFKDADIAILIGARPRSKGMEQKDLLVANAAIFAQQGKALNAVASRDVKVLVVGNPANTNALIAMSCAPDLPRENFTAMLRLDHNRAVTQLAFHLSKPIASIDRLFVWGTHSPQMYVDLRYATVEGKPIIEKLDKAWYHSQYIPTIVKRGNQVIEARGLAAVASAANAALTHIRDWVLGSEGRWLTMGVCSDGSYDIPAGLIYGMPVTTEDGKWRIVQNLSLDAFSRSKLDADASTLQEERDNIKHLLK